MEGPARLPRALAVLTAALLVASTAGAAIVARRDAPTAIDTKVLSAGGTPETPPAAAAPPAPTRATGAPSPEATAEVTAVAEPVAASALEPGAASVVGTDPTCARLPAGLTKEDLLGQRWFARRVEGQVGGRKLWIEVLPCDLYDGEGLQLAVHVEGKPATLEYVVDYGDGTSYAAPPMDLCQTGLPATMFGRGASKAYARPGTYTVQVHVTFRGCAGAAPQQTTLSVPVERVAGPRPVPAPELELQPTAS